MDKLGEKSRGKKESRGRTSAAMAKCYLTYLYSTGRQNNDHLRAPRAINPRREAGGEERWLGGRQPLCWSFHLEKKSYRGPILRTLDPAEKKKEKNVQRSDISFSEGRGSLARKNFQSPRRKDPFKPESV